MIVPDAAKEWMALQRPLSAESTVGDVTELIEPEVRAAVAMLPAGISSILDIGCGVGLTTLWLRQLTGASCDGLDGTGRDDVRSGYGLCKDVWNDVSVTKAVWAANDASDINIYTPDSLPTKTYDLLVSFAAWGWHFPIETYDAKALLNDGGYVAIDTRDRVTRVPRTWKLLGERRVNHKRVFRVFQP